MEKAEEKLQRKEKPKIVHFRVVFFAFLSLLLGIIFARKVLINDLKYILIVIALFGVILFFCIRSRKFAPLLICLLIFAIGCGLFTLAITKFDNKKCYEGYHVITGRVVTDNEDTAEIIIENVSLDEENIANVSIILDESNFGRINCGDVICFVGKVTKINLFKMGNFNTKYIRDGVCYTCYADFEDIVIIENTGLKFDESIRRKIKDTLYGAMDEDSAGIAYAVITGDKDGICDENYLAFKKTGIVHILCVSGLHVGVLAGAIAFVLKKLKAKNWINLLVNIIVLGFYCYLCGFSPSVVRASVMSLVFLFANICGKEPDKFSSIGFAGIFLCLINPLYAFDTGFLMSFFCVIFITLFYTPVYKILRKFLPQKVSSFLAVSICAEIGILPFIASFYASFNFLLFFVNMFIVPFFSVLFVVLLVTLILSMIFAKLSFLLFLPDIGIRFMIEVANVFSDGVFSVDLLPIPTIISILLCLSVFSLSYFFMANKKVKIYTFLMMLVFTMVFGLVSTIEPLKKTEVYYYYNNYTLSIFMRSKNGKTMAFNFSSDENKFFDYINIHHVDYFIRKTKPNEATIEAYKDYNIQKFVVLNENTTEGNMISLYEKRKGYIDNFYVEIVDYENKNLGLKVKVDDLSIFVDFENKIEYNMYEKLEKEINSCEVAFISYGIINANLNLDCLKITKYYDSFSDISYEKVGNMNITKANNIVKVRSID